MSMDNSDFKSCVPYVFYCLLGHAQGFVIKFCNTIQKMGVLKLMENRLLPSTKASKLLL